MQERQLQTSSAIERRLGTVCLSNPEFYAESYYYYSEHSFLQSSVQKAQIL